jgi:membrane-bound inhibitor of C-type lysozyme
MSILSGLHSMQRVFLLAALLILAGCSSDAPQRPLPSAYYGCDDGSGLFVVFEPNAAKVKLESGTTVTLPQQRAASGMWYRSPAYDLRGKGDEATWTATGLAPTQCAVK